MSQQDVMRLFDEGTQSLSEAKQIADAAVAEGRGMNPGEQLRHDRLFNEGMDKRALMREQQAKDSAARIAQIQGEMAEFINSGGADTPKQARRMTRAYHEQFDARSVPYRWHAQGPAHLRSSAPLESEIPNPNLEEDWGKILGRRSSVEYQRDMEEYLATSPKNMRAAQMDLDELGGFWLAPIQMNNDILKIADDMVYIRQMADVIARVDAQSLGTTYLEKDLEDADWKSELGKITEAIGKFGKRVLRPKEMEKYVAMSFRASMQVPSLSAWLVERLGYKRGVTEERAYFVGNGVNEALGCMVNSTNGIGTDRDVKRGNSATEISLVGLQSTKWHIHSGFWDENMAWFGAREFYRQVSTMRGSDGHPVWQMSLSWREPDRLLSFRAYISEFCPAVFTANQYVGILGNWRRGFQIADAYDTMIQRVDQQFATDNLILYIMRACTDGAPVLPPAFARVQLGS